ncbi:MAG: hypothetical protein R2854_12110 [Caldilineaceae bacterium]
MPDLDFTIERLGAAMIPSPMKAVHFVDDGDRAFPPVAGGRIELS